MKVTHAELFRHIKARGENPNVIYKVERACEEDLAEAGKAYDAAIIRYENAAEGHEKNWAEAEMTYARAVYLEKSAAYEDFYAI